MPCISVCIPAYEMHGRGTAFLARVLRSLDRQSFYDFEVVVSDHSQNDALENLCRTVPWFFPLRYVRCTFKRGNGAANTNFAVRHAIGDIVKIIHQDDFFYSDDALRRIAAAVAAAPDRHWGGVGCVQVDETESRFYGRFVPAMHPRMLYGRNTFGAPSLMFVRRDRYLDLDEALLWRNDCDLYHRMAQQLGEPLVLADILVAVRQWRSQTTHTLVTPTLQAIEHGYVLAKHNQPPGPGE